MGKSKYIMSRMSISLKNLRLVETTPMRLLHSIISTDIIESKDCVLYLNKNKTKGLVYINGVFGIVEQKSIFDMHRDGTTYDTSYINYKDGINMLKTMIRAEKIKKIKKKI